MKALKDKLKELEAGMFCTYTCTCKYQLGFMKPTVAMAEWQLAKQLSVLCLDDF